MKFILAMVLTMPLLADYAPIHGLKLYYEIHGKADAKNPPLVLLHGGGSTIDSSFARAIPIFAKSRQVIAFDQQGHGRTTDIAERPFSFEQSADDAAALLAHLGIEHADFLGYSNGGTIALQIAIRHPKLVRRLVVVSGMYRCDAVEEAFWEGMRHASLDSMPQELKDAYTRVAPNPENLQSFHDKSVQRMLTFKDLPDSALRAITAPTLIVQGDRDVTRPEHATAMWRVLPNAQLAILPNTDHMQIVEWRNIDIIEQFLDSSTR